MNNYLCLIILSHPELITLVLFICNVVYKYMA